MRKFCRITTATGSGRFVLLSRTDPFISFVSEKRLKKSTKRFKEDLFLARFFESKSLEVQERFEKQRSDFSAY